MIPSPSRARSKALSKVDFGTSVIVPVFIVPKTQPVLMVTGTGATGVLVLLVALLSVLFGGFDVLLQSWTQKTKKNKNFKIGNIHSFSS